jgi:Zn-dependent oligopeptidase
LYAAQIWQHLFENEPLSKEGGKKLWKRMLGFGAARDNLAMLEELGDYYHRIH